MRITHGHSQAGVPQYFLQRKDVAAVLNEVTGKGMPQTMASLSTRQINRSSSQCSPKRCNRPTEQTMLFPMRNYPAVQLRRNGHRPNLATLGATETDNSIAYGGWLQAFHADSHSQSVSTPATRLSAQWSPRQFPLLDTQRFNQLQRILIGDLTKTAQLIEDGTHVAQFIVKRFS
jgi:hypothetical protein